MGSSAVQPRVNQPTASFKVICIDSYLHCDTHPSMKGHDEGVAFYSWPWLLQSFLHHRVAGVMLHWGARISVWYLSVKYEDVRNNCQQTIRFHISGFSSVNLGVPLEISESISGKNVVLMAAQIESSGWENNMKRVASAAFSRQLLLARNFSWNISVNRNMAAHPRCLLMSGAVHRRYYCIICAPLMVTLLQCPLLCTLLLQEASDTVLTRSKPNTTLDIWQAKICKKP